MALLTWQELALASALGQGLVLAKILGQEVLGGRVVCGLLGCGLLGCGLLGCGLLGCGFLGFRSWLCCCLSDCFELLLGCHMLFGCLAISFVLFLSMLPWLVR